MTFKKTIKSYLKENFFLSLFVSRAWAFLNACLAFFYRLKYFSKAYIPFSVKLIGIRNIVIGKNSSVGARSWLNVNDRGSSKNYAIKIGENCIIGQENFFTTGDKIEIGDYCLTARNCSFIGSSHCYDDPFVPYSCSGTKSDDSIKVGVNCFFGYGAQVIGNVTIGHGSIIGASAVVKTDVPPFSLVVGNPAKVIKRYDFGSNCWVRFPSDEIIFEGPTEEEYFKLLKSQYGFIVQPISVVSGVFFDLR